MKEAVVQCPLTLLQMGFFLFGLLKRSRDQLRLRRRGGLSGIVTAERLEISGLM